MEQLKCMYQGTEKKESELNHGFPVLRALRHQCLLLVWGFKMGHLAYGNARGASPSCSVCTSRAVGKRSWYLQLSSLGIQLLSRQLWPYQPPNGRSLEDAVRVASLHQYPSPHGTRGPGQHRTEEFRKVNALMKVPALRDGSFTLAESIAILLYLVRKFKTPDHWYPCDLQKRARVDEYLSWQHVNIRGKGSKLFLTKVLLPMLTGQPLSPEKLEAVTEELNVVLKQFEEKFLQDKPFIAGSEISLADLVALVELMQPVGAGYDLFEERPKLAAWRGRVEEAVGKQLFQEAHEGILNAKNLTADKIAPELLEHFKHQLLKQASQN